MRHKDWPLLARVVRIGEIWYCDHCGVRSWVGNMVFMHRRTRDEACATCVVHDGVLL